ncbi:unnamed protein product [Arabidopsis halleri]
MRNLKSLVILALLFSLSLAVFANTSNDATHVKDEVKPSTEATDAIEPQKREGKPQIEEAEVEANDAVVEPQQGWGGGGCSYGCCGGWWRGSCRYCCRSPAEANEVVETVEPQQGGRGGGGGGGSGGCRYGCCGGWWRGRCRYCCRTQAEASEVVETVEPNDVEPQQGARGGGGGGGRGGCRYGCCGGWWRGRCRYCCRTQAEASEVVETVEPNDVEPQQGGRGGGGGGGGGGGCRYGCCGGWWRGRCRYCCRTQAEANEVVETVEAQQAKP